MAKASATSHAIRKLSSAAFRPRATTASTERSRPAPDSTEAGVADRQSEEFRRAGAVDPQGLGPQLDLVTEQGGHLIGVAGAAEETQRRGPPRGRAVRPVGTRRRGEVLTQHHGPQLGPGGWPKAWSWATASNATNCTLVTATLTSDTVDGEYSRCDRAAIAGIVKGRKKHPQS